MEACRESYGTRPHFDQLQEKRTPSVKRAELTQQSRLGMSWEFTAAGRHAHSEEPLVRSLWFIKFRLHRRRQLKQQSHARQSRARLTAPASPPMLSAPCSRNGPFSLTGRESDCPAFLQRTVGSFPLCLACCLQPNFLPAVLPGPLGQSVLTDHLLPPLRPLQEDSHPLVNECSWWSREPSLPCEWCGSIWIQTVD